eukprot:403336458
MITDDGYLPGLQVLHYTLRKFTSRLLVIILAENVKKITEMQIKKLSNVMIKRVKPILNPHEKSQTDNASSWVGSGYTKLYIWTLIQFQKVFYIDADCLISSNPENAFDRNSDFAAAPDVFPPDRFNAGVLLIKPSMTVFRDMISKILTFPAYDGGDTGFLNAYYPDWYLKDSDSRLPYGYNAQRTLYWFTIKRTDGYWKEIINSKEGLVIIHYSSSPKPWVGQPKGDLELLWFQTYMEMLQKGKM